MPGIPTGLMFNINSIICFDHSLSLSLLCVWGGINRYIKIGGNQVNSIGIPIPQRVLQLKVERSRAWTRAFLSSCGVVRHTCPFRSYHSSLLLAFFFCISWERRNDKYLPLYQGYQIWCSSLVRDIHRVLFYKSRETWGGESWNLVCLMNDNQAKHNTKYPFILIRCCARLMWQL